MFVLGQFDSADERLANTHCSKIAYIYFRYASAGYVQGQHAASVSPCRLSMALGCSIERVYVIDDFRGKSGSGNTKRFGFQKPIARIEPERVRSMNQL